MSKKNVHKHPASSFGFVNHSFLRNINTIFLKLLDIMGRFIITMNCEEGIVSCDDSDNYEDSVKIYSSIIKIYRMLINFRVDILRMNPSPAKFIKDYIKNFDLGYFFHILDKFHHLESPDGIKHGIKYIYLSFRNVDMELLYNRITNSDCAYLKSNEIYLEIRKILSSSIPRSLTILFNLVGRLMNSFYYKTEDINDIYYAITGIHSKLSLFREEILDLDPYPLIKVNNRKDRFDMKYLLDLLDRNIEHISKNREYGLQELCDFFSIENKINSMNDENFIEDAPVYRENKSIRASVHVKYPYKPYVPQKAPTCSNDMPEINHSAGEKFRALVGDEAYTAFLGKAGLS